MHRSNSSRPIFETGVDLVRTARGDLLLMTETLVYDLQPLRTAGADETWNIASCNNARLRDEVHLGRRQNVAIPAHRIEIIRFSTASRRLQELRADALDWSAAFDTTSEGDPTLAVRRGLLLAQISEALFKAVEIAPVKVVNQRRHGGKRIVELAASDSEHRMRLAQALRVDDPHKLLRRLFEREESDFDAEWQLTETAGLGSTTRAAAGVRFTRVVQKENPRLYEFEVIDGVVPPNAQLHLRKVDDTGTEQSPAATSSNVGHAGNAVGTRSHAGGSAREIAQLSRRPPSLDFRRRQQKLVQSNRCKTGPGKAVAGRPVASVA